MIVLNVLLIARGVFVLFASARDLDALLAWQPDFGLVRSKLSKEVFQLVLVCLLCLLVFSAYLMRFFYHGVCYEKHSLPFIYDINIVNSEAIVFENRARFDRLLSINNTVHWFADVGHLCRDLIFPNKSPAGRRLSFRQQLPNVPIISAAVRGRLFLRVVFFEVISAVTLVLVVIMLMIIARVYLVHVVHHFAIVWIVYCVFGYLWLVVVLVHLLKMATIIVGLVNTTQAGLYHILAMINQEYHKIATGKIPAGAMCQVVLLCRLQKTMHAQKDMIDYILHNNRVYVRLFVIFFFTNAPISALLVLIVLFQSVDNQQLLVMSIFMQVFGSLLAVVPLALSTRLLQVSSKYFVSIQSKITTNFLRSKWRCHARFELLHSHQPIGYNVGPLGVTTPKTLFEFVFFYGGFLLFVRKLLRKLEHGCESC